MASVIPVEVQRFLWTHIRSLDQLEVLLLVCSSPDQEWSGEAVYEVVRSNLAVVTDRLESFCRAGVLARSGEPPRYRYAPQTEELRRQIAALDAAYKLGRHRIVELIYTRPTDPLLEFSDAFKLKPRE
jgi:hypothetical protein